MTPPLDSETPEGLKWVRNERVIHSRIRRTLGAEGIVCGVLPERPIDCAAMKGGKLACAIEIKSRRLTLLKLRQFGTYLITEEKLLTLIRAGWVWGIHSALFIHLVEDDSLVWWLVGDPAGEKIAIWETAETTTQATCNGGKANRRNAFLNLAQMRMAAHHLPEDDQNLELFVD